MAMIAWKGGEIPVSRYADVRVRLRDGNTDTSPAGSYDWSHSANGSAECDIVAYEVLGAAPVEVAPPGTPWIAHDGGGMPTFVGNPMVRVRTSVGVQEPRLAGQWVWDRVGLPGDILAYQVYESSPLDKAGLGDSQDALTFDPAWAKAVAESVGGSVGGCAPPVIAPAPADVGNTDANGEGKQTNPKDVIGSRKAKLSVIPAPVLFDIGLAMTEGMCKYGRHNYRIAGVRSSVYYDAAMGHLMDWWEGQDIDAESELSHVTKAIASLVVLRDAMFQKKLIDDRPPRSLVLKEDFNPLTAGIIDRHKDKNPRHFTIADTQEAA